MACSKSLVPIVFGDKIAKFDNHQRWKRDKDISIVQEHCAGHFCPVKKYSWVKSKASSHYIPNFICLILTRYLFSFSHLKNITESIAVLTSQSLFLGKVSIGTISPNLVSISLILSLFFKKLCLKEKFVFLSELSAQLRLDCFGKTENRRADGHYSLLCTEL